MKVLFYRVEDFLVELETDAAAGNVHRKIVRIFPESRTKPNASGLTFTKATLVATYCTESETFAPLVALEQAVGVFHEFDAELTALALEKSIQIGGRIEAKAKSLGLEVRGGVIVPFPSAA